MTLRKILDEKTSAYIADAAIVICEHMIKVETLQSRVELNKAGSDAGCSTYAIGHALDLLIEYEYIYSLKSSGWMGCAFQWRGDYDDSFIPLRKNIYYTGI